MVDAEDTGVQFNRDLDAYCALGKKWSSLMKKTRLSLSIQIAHLTYRESQCKFSISCAKSSPIDSSCLRVVNQYHAAAVVLCQFL